MKPIIHFGASTSRQSINRQFAGWAARRLGETHNILTKGLDLNEFELPLFSVDLEAADGIPPAAIRFYGEIRDSQGIIISLAEHNGSYAAAFKNLLDWVSRHEEEVWDGKPMLLLSTSPGGRGGASVMSSALATFPHLGAKVAASFSLPRFNQHFSPDSGISDPALASAFSEALRQFAAALSLPAPQNPG